MKRPTLEVADILRQHGADLINQMGASLTHQQRRVMRALSICRTAALGGHMEQCDNPECGHRVPCYDSCRNRHCPKCQRLDQLRWIEARQQQLLPIPYFHVVFTLPHQLLELVHANPALCYKLLFAAAAQTVQTLAADPKHLGAQVGFFAILHTWGQQLTLHPHLHLVVTGGGLAPDGQSWVPANVSKNGKHFFLPVKVMSSMFRNRYLQGLRLAFQQQQLQFPPVLQELAQPAQFTRHLAALRQSSWVVYCKPPFGSPAQAIEYLGRYTHRIAISNHRLISLQDGQVSFYWRDYRHGDKQKVLRLDAVEFLRRFLLHVLPPRLVRIRYYGLLANCHVRTQLHNCRQLLDVPPATLLLPLPNRDWLALLERITGTDPKLCPRCHTGHLLAQPIPPPALAAHPPPQLPP